MRILYVEDNPANLFLVQRVARMGNHEVVNYTEGQPALDHFKDDKPDLVLMDIQLSGKLNGLEVVKALRAAGHRTPIVAVTAYAMSGDREKCIEAGCDGYLSKPLPVGELVELFRRYEPAKKPGEAPVPAAPTASVTVAPEPKLDIVPGVKPVAAIVEPTPETVSAPPVPETKTDTPANSSPTPVPPADTATPPINSDALNDPVEKPAVPVVEAKVESPATAAETPKPAVSTNAVDPAASQGMGKESGEKIELESKQS
jgi:CheY-like chemotaxis protein